MSRRNSLLVLFLAAALVWLLSAGVARAAAPAPVFRVNDDFLPPSPSGGGSGPGAPLYERYSVWHYTYGFRLEGPDTVHRLAYTVNMAQVSKAWLLKLGLRTVEYALRVDLVGPMVDRAGLAMEQVAGALWEQDRAALVEAGLAVAGLLALGAYLFRGRPAAGLRILGGAGVVLVGSYLLFAGAPDALATSAGVARALGNQVVNALGVVAPAGPGGLQERLIRGAGDRAWQALVLDPWVAGEFTPDAIQKEEYRDGDLPGGAWLARTPTERMRQYTLTFHSAIRTDFVQGSADYYWDYLPRRAVLTGVTAGATLVYAGVLVLLAGGVLYYQLLLLAMLALAPLWLVLALWHPGGLPMVRGAVVRAVGALVAQLVLMTVLGVLLLLTPALWIVTAPLGWMAQGLVLALLALVLYRYRFRWLSWGREAGRREPGEAVVQGAGVTVRPALAGTGAERTVALPPPAGPVHRMLEQSVLVSTTESEPGRADPQRGEERDLDEEFRLLRSRLGQAAAGAAGRPAVMAPVGRGQAGAGELGQSRAAGEGELPPAGAGPSPAESGAGARAGVDPRHSSRSEGAELHLYRNRWK